MSSNQNINPKDCSYGCSTRIYWNTVENAYFEVFNQKRHLCPNRVNKPSVIANNNTYAVTGGSTTRTSTKPTYYSKMPWNTQPKPKMSNSFELLTGSIDAIQKKYEILSDVVSEYNGKFMVLNEIEIPKQDRLICWYIMKCLWEIGKLSSRDIAMKNSKISLLIK